VFFIQSIPLSVAWTSLVDVLLLVLFIRSPAALPAALQLFLVHCPLRAKLSTFTFAFK
jgi:hypothetical protein